MAKGRILVVDDEVYIVHILDFSLGMEGYEVVTALDGEQALEKVAQQKPDLIVLDIMMPKLDGYETCKALKSRDETKDIPVILLSAKGRNVDQKTGTSVAATQRQSAYTEVYQVASSCASGECVATMICDPFCVTCACSSRSSSIWRLIESAASGSSSM